MSYKPVVRFIIFGARSQFGQFVTVGRQVEACLPCPSVMVVQNRSVQGKFKTFVFRLSHISHIAAYSRSGRKTYALQQVGGFLNVILKCTGQASSQQGEVQTEVPCRRIFPPQFGIRQFGYIVTGDIAGRTEVIRTGCQASPGLVRINSLVGGLSVTYTQFQDIYPVHLVHKLFLTNVPSCRYGGISVPLVSLCQT